MLGTDRIGKSRRVSSHPNKLAGSDVGFKQVFSRYLRLKNEFIFWSDRGVVPALLPEMKKGRI